jgi:hypothetical protein
MFLVFMGAWGVIGLAIGFWHRSLMVRLHTSRPDIWSQLGGRIFPGDQWSSSLRQPVWSWKSICFFMLKRYEDLGDPDFAKQAAAFRYIWSAWVIGFLIAQMFFFHH